MTRALDASREAGHDLTFLLAVRDDWPKELYAKLGFDEIGRVWEFLLPRVDLRGRGSYHRRTSKGGNDGPERVLGEADRR